MAHATREISNLCRFCLSEDGLIHVSKATASLLTIQDIVHFTGVQITEEEQLSFAMCDICCKVLENAVGFRSTCQENDFVFKQLYAMLIKRKEEVEDHKDMANIEACKLADGENDQRIGERITQLYDISVESESKITQIIAASKINNSTERSVKKEKHRMTDGVGSIAQTVHQIHASNTEERIKKKGNVPREMELCATCGKLVSCIYKHNANQHSKEKTFTCPYCQIEMKNRSNMMRHINAVHKKKIVKKCEQCGQGFTHKNSYLSHMQSQHGIGETFECKVCAKTFKLAAYYRAHMRVWHSTKEYPCTTCAMVFNKRKSLTIHQRVHSSDQPYACHLCPKKFKSSYARKTHVLTHSGIRFQCSVCEKSYRYKSLLSIHYRKDHDCVMPLEAND